MNSPEVSFRVLGMGYARSRWFQMMLLAALLLAGIALKIINPQIVRHFIDQAHASGPERELWMAALLFLTVSLVYRLISVATTYTGEHLVWASTNALRSDLAAHCLDLDLSFHNHHTPGEMVQRIDDDVTALGNLLSRMAFRVLGNGLLVLAILLLLFREDPLIGAVLAFYTGVTAILLRCVQSRAVRRWSRERQAAARLSSFQEEVLTSTEDIRSQGAVSFVMRRLEDIMEEALARFRDAFMAGSAASAVTQLLHALGHVTGLAVAVHLYRQEAITIGTAVLVLHYTAMLSGPLEEIRRETSDLQSAAASVERIDGLLLTRPSVVETFRQPLPPGPLPVDFDRVSFHYEESRPALADVSFSLPAGKVLGVLGHTGGGKTTLTRLLFRLMDPSSGSIRLGGVDIRRVALEELRRRVGLVTQEIQLFTASVRDNLTLFGPDKGDGHLERILETVGLGPWLRSLPDGLDTTLSPAGAGISAGEQQLLSLARVFLRDPDLVVMDEASSRIDPATARLVARATDSRLAGRTGIIIAHRLATVDRADLILILENGRAVEVGPRLQLARSEASRYSHLLRADGRGEGS